MIFPEAFSKLFQREGTVFPSVPVPEPFCEIHLLLVQVVRFNIVEILLQRVEEHMILNPDYCFRMSLKLLQLFIQSAAPDHPVIDTDARGHFHQGALQRLFRVDVGTGRVVAFHLSVVVSVNRRYPDCRYPGLHGDIHYPDLVSDTGHIPYHVPQVIVLYPGNIQLLRRNPVIPVHHERVPLHQFQHRVYNCFFICPAHGTAVGGFIHEAFFSAHHLCVVIHHLLRQIIIQSVCQVNHPAPAVTLVFRKGIESILFLHLIIYRVHAQLFR